MLFLGLVLALNTALAAASKYTNVSISTDQYDQLVRGIHFCKVSYCMNETDFGTGSFGDICSENSFCSDNPNIEIIKTVHPSSDNASGTAYVAADHDNSEVFVVFRGSSTDGDWDADYTFSLCDYAPVTKGDFSSINLTLSTSTSEINEEVSKHGDADLCEDCKVSCGLMVGYTHFMDEIYNVTVPLLDEGYNLTVTGHSLGGGYAVFAALDFKLQGYNPLLITYAALKVGNEQFNTFTDFMFKTMKTSESIADGDEVPFGAYARVYNPWDVIPMLPPTTNYTHSGLQFELMTTVVPQEKQDVYFQGPADNFTPDDTIKAVSLFTNGSYPMWEYHTAYFIDVTPCNSPDVSS